MVTRWIQIDDRCPAHCHRGNESAKPARSEDTLPPFDLPAVRRKKVTADFKDGLISLDGGLLLLRAVKRRLGLAEGLANCIRK